MPDNYEHNFDETPDPEDYIPWDCDNGRPEYIDEDDV
jgi:hypothetical protein